MKNKIRSPLVIAVIFIPLTGVFPITEKISFQLLIFASIFFLFLRKIKIKSDDFYLGIICVISILISTIANFSVRGLSYSLALILSYLIYVNASKILVLELGEEKFFKYLFYTCLATNVFIIQEFISVNYFGSILLDFPRSSRSLQYEPIFANRFIRARGFAEESGHMGLFYEAIVPIVLFKLKDITNNTSIRVIFKLTTLISIILLFSSFTTLVALVYMVFYFVKNNYSVARKTLLISGSILALISSLSWILTGLLTKLSLSSNTFSTNDRLARYYCIIQSINEWNPLIGNGPLKLGQRCQVYDSSLNLYMDILIFYGIIGIIPLLILVIRKYQKIANYSKKYMKLSLILILGHYFIISNFWYPYLYILIGIYSALSWKKREMAL